MTKYGFYLVYKGGFTSRNYYVLSEHSEMHHALANLQCCNFIKTVEENPSVISVLWDEVQHVEIWKEED